MSAMFSPRSCWAGGGEGDTADNIAEARDMGHISPALS